MAKHCIANNGTLHSPSNLSKSTRHYINSCIMSRITFQDNSISLQIHTNIETNLIAIAIKCMLYPTTLFKCILCRSRMCGVQYKIRPDSSLFRFDIIIHFNSIIFYKSFEYIATISFMVYSAHAGNNLFQE